MQKYLQEAGIVPSDTATYKTSEVVDTLAKHYGAKPEVMCACPGKGMWGEPCDAAKIDSVSRARHQRLWTIAVQQDTMREVGCHAVRLCRASECC